MCLLTWCWTSKSCAEACYSEIPRCVTLVDFTQRRQSRLCNGFGWKCRTEIVKTPPLLKIAVQERAKKAWAEAEALCDFLPWACCLSDLMATAWVHELPRSHALPSLFICCLLIFFCKAPLSYKLQLWLLINCHLRTGLVWTINSLISEGAFHLWVGNSDPTHSSSLGKSLAPDGLLSASWNVAGTAIPLLPAQGTMSPATTSPVLPRPQGSRLIQAMKRHLSSPRLHGTRLPKAGGDTSLLLSYIWDEPRESCEHLQARQTDLGLCSAQTVLKVDRGGQGFGCLPSCLAQVKKHLPGTLIFRPKPYFLCSLNYILAWRYLFSVTQINVCFNYLCQTEHRENSALVEVVWFTAVEIETPCPINSCLKDCCRATCPSSGPSRGRGPCYATSTSRFMYALSVDAANDGLQFHSCTYNAGHVGIQRKIQASSQSPIHI